MPAHNLERVLVVEDDCEIATIIEQVLRDDGRVIERASDGVEALRSIRAKKPTAIVLDLMIPRLNGFEILRDIAAFDASHLSRVVVLTGCAEETLRHFDEKRVYGLIRKPFEISELRQAVDSCCRQARDSS